MVVEWGVVGGVWESGDPVVWCVIIHRFLINI